VVVDCLPLVPAAAAAVLLVSSSAWPAIRRLPSRLLRGTSASRPSTRSDR